MLFKSSERKKMQLIENPVPLLNDAKWVAAFIFDLDIDSVLHITKPTSANTFLSTQSQLRYGAEVLCACMERRALFGSDGNYPEGWA